MHTLGTKACQHLGPDYYLLTDAYDNKKYQNYICSIVPQGYALIFSECSEELLKKLKGKKVLVNGAYLALILSQYVNQEDIAVISYQTEHKELGLKAKLIHNDIDRKANMTMNIMLNAFEQKFDITHDFKIC